ncbi:MAG: hypothetical protein QW058_01985 [Candidatus Aenigmatarchaeota archaeon]
MAIFEGALGLGVGFLLAIALAQYAKIKLTKGWQLLVASAVLFLSVAAWSSPAVAAYISPNIGLLREAFEIVAWLLALLGALLIVYEGLVEIF